MCSRQRGRGSQATRKDSAGQQSPDKATCKAIAKQYDTAIFRCLRMYMNAGRQESRPEKSCHALLSSSATSNTGPCAGANAELPKRCMHSACAGSVRACHAPCPHLPCSSLGSRLERLTKSRKRRRTLHLLLLKWGRLVTVVTS